jgi:2'-5' RNA ligase
VTTLRLFAGLALPPALRARIALLQGGIPGARWVPEENYHLTLAFIGNVDEEVAERADEALASVHAENFSLKIEGAGSFSDGDKPRVLWLGVEKNDALIRLQEKIQRALIAARVPIEARKFTPHVTLARLKNPDLLKLAEFLHTHGGFSVPPFAVESFVLYQSHQTKNGSVYEELRKYVFLTN